ncbi:hypothetical protein TrLO_g14254, partial [Triparma laevis f. longispina]
MDGSKGFEENVAELKSQIARLEKRLEKLETLTTFHTKSLADRGEKKAVVKDMPKYKLWRINKMRLREITNKQKKYGAIVPGMGFGWFISKGLPFFEHGRSGALIGGLLTMFFGGLPGEPGRTIRKVGAPVSLISLDVLEFYKRIRFIYETGGVSYKTWQQFDAINQKTGLLPRIGAFQHWRLRFVKSEKEYLEVMEERESARLGMVAFLNNVALDRQKAKEEREEKKRKMIEDNRIRRENDPNVRIRPVRWWRRFRGVENPPLEATPAEAEEDSTTSSSASTEEIDKPSKTDKLLGRVMWGEDLNPYVSDIVKREMEAKERKKEDKKKRKKRKKDTSNKG